MSRFTRSRPLAARAAILSVLAASCQTFDGPAPSSWGGAPEAPAAMSELSHPAGAAPAPAVGGVAEAEAGPGSRAALGLEEALRLAFRSAPELRAAADALRAADARLEAAGRGADPELSLGAEGVPFSAPRSDDEWIVGLSQELRLSGQGAAAEGVAQARRDLAAVEQQAGALRLETRVRGAFARALALQQASLLLERRRSIGAALAGIAEARVEHGDLLPAALRELRAEAAVQAQERADAALLHEVARRELAELVGVHVTELGALTGELEAALALADLETLVAEPLALPAGAGARAEAELVRWRAELAEARRVPSVELGLAYRRRGDGRDSFDAGVVFGLPITGARSAEARAARFEEAAAGQRAAAVQRDHFAAVRAAHAELRTALLWARLTREELLPAAAAERRVIAARVAAGDLPRAALLAAEDHDARLRLDQLAAHEELLGAWTALRAALLPAGGG